MGVLLLGALMFGVPGVSLRAQDIKILVKADTALTNKADRLRDSAKAIVDDHPRTSLTLLAQALTLYEKAGAGLDQEIVLWETGEIYRVLHRPDSALVFQHRALPLAIAEGWGRQEVDVYTAMAMSHADLNQMDSAFAYYNRALRMTDKAFDASGSARIEQEIGALFERVGQPDSALWYLGVAVGNDSIKADTAHMADDLNGIGMVYHDMGRADSAIATYVLSLRMHRIAGDRQGAAYALQNIGVVYGDIGQPDSAMAYYRQALELERAIGDRQGEGTTLHNIGGVYTVLDRGDSAGVYLAQALAIRRDTGDSLGIAKTYINIAGWLTLGGQLDSARTLLWRAIELSEAAHSRTVEGVAWAAFGQVNRMLKLPDQALAALVGANFLQMQTGDRAHQAETFAEFGRLYRSQGSLVAATSAFERSAILAASVSSSAGDEFNQLQYNEKSSDTFGSWAQSWLDRARSGSAPADSTAAAYAALAASERGRAQALLRLMGTVRVIHPGADLAAEGRVTAGRALTSAAGALIYAMADDTLITWLALRDGTIHVSEQLLPQARLDTLVAALRFGVAQDDATVERGGHITRGDSPLLDPLDQKMLTPSTRTRAKADNGIALRREMSSLLLPAELAKYLPASGELLIVPQGGLGLIPFGVLPIAGSNALLGERYALRYGPSLTAIADAEARPALAAGDRTRQLAPALVVGDPSMPAPFALDGERYSFDPLPGARTEGKAVADSLGVVQWLSGPQATEAVVRAAIPNARLIHLATHGLVYSSDAHSRLSFVALAPDTAHDGHLSVAKIVDSLTFRAELVVLSACQTAVGNVKSAEGTLGLQRAVLAKGARSVLVSLWNVSDEATLFLVERFYHHWLHDANAPTKSEALRLAQADVRAEAAKTRAHQAWADPFYWAAFQLVGAP